MRSFESDGNPPALPSFRRRLRRQWFLAGLLVGGAIAAIVVDVALQAWSIFHTFVWSGSQTPAVVAAGIFFPFWVTGIFLIAAVAGMFVSIATGLEAMWRRLSPNKRKSFPPG